MALVTLACLFLAITPAYIQRQQVELQGTLYWLVGIAGTIALVVFLGLCLYRLWIEKKSGALLFQPTQSFWMRWIFACIMVPLNMVVLVASGHGATTLIWASGQIPGEGFSLQAYLLTVALLTIPISALVAAIVLPTWGLGMMSLEVRKQGAILSGWRYLPWNSGVEFESQPAKNRDRMVVKILLGKATSTSIIHSDEYEDLEQHLLAVGIPIKQTDKAG